ncbi:MAG: hypothetical protein QOF12_2931 [Solirubrobacteraceae bacterium]|nr:hypothetical protein [Solirubrobacteraceae bacterium]
MTALDHDDAPRGPAGRDPEGFSDALTYAFSDPAGDVCGVARLGLSGEGASGLVTLFRGGEQLAVQADGDGEAAARWEDVRAAGLATETLEPGLRWRLRHDGETTGLDLEFEAVGAPFALAADSPVGRAGGMEGFDVACRVAGTVDGQAFAGLGQRGRSWGAPDWERMTLARTLTAWFEEGRGVSAVAIRPTGASNHADEVVAAFVLDEEVREVADVRISTTYDASERQRAAGLELYVAPEDDYPQRIAGEAVAGTSLDLGRLRLECAFFRWRTGGQEGVGRYDVLRRV